MQKILRSMILEKFPFDLRVKIELLSRKRGIENKAKQEELFKLFREANIDNITPLGSGTNRYAFKMNGFVVKVATDHDGKIDNLKEMKMAKRLFPDVTKVYEVTENGTLLVAEYIQPFQSFGEMQRYADQIRDILKKISQVYLIGDVGLDSKNYANWGLRVGSDNPVCLDFAYIYDAKSDLFICGNCNTGSMLVPNSDYTQLVCPNPLCGHKYNFEDIRGRMSNETHAQEIGDLSEEAYLLSESNVLTELTPNRSNYLKRKIIPKESKAEEKQEEMKFDNFIFNKEEETMTSKATTIMAKAILANGGIITTPKKNDEVAFSGEITNDTTIIQATSVKVVSKEQDSVSVPNDPAESKDLPEEAKVETEQSAIEEKEVFDIESDMVKEPDTEPTPVTAEIVKPTTPEKAEVVKPVDTHTKAATKVVTPTPEEKPKSHNVRISDDFKTNITRCLTKISNKIKGSLYQMEIWDEVRDNYMSAKAKPRPNGIFYDAVQSAIFHSLTKFLKMKPVQQEEGGKKQWICSKFEDTPYEGTLVFLDRWYGRKCFNDATNPVDGMAQYTKTHTDYLGIQREWLDDLRRTLKEKLKDVEPDGINFITDTIAENWCVPKLVFEQKVENAVQTMVDQGIIENNDGVITLTDKGKQAEEQSQEASVEAPSEDDEGEEMLAFSASILDKIDSNSSTQIDTQLYTEDESEDEDEDDETLNDTEVLIYPDENIDIIRLKFSDTFGNVEIPLYQKLSDIDPNDVIPSMADERNGDWDWLIHIVPDLRFVTSDPDRWMDLNNDDEVDDTVRFLILDPDYKGQTLMAMYAINGIFTVDENGVRHVESNPTILKQLNNLFKSEIGNGAISHYARNISDDELVRDEDYAKMVLNGYLPEDEDEDDEGSSAEPTVVSAEEDSEELGIMDPIPRRYN